MLSEAEHTTRRASLVSRLTGKRHALEDALLTDPENADALRDECSVLEQQITDVDAMRRAAVRIEAKERATNEGSARAATIAQMTADSEQAVQIACDLAKAITDAGALLVELARVTDGMRVARYNLASPGARASFAFDAALWPAEIETALRMSGLLRNPGGIAHSLDLVELVAMRTRQLVVGAVQSAEAA